MTVRSLDGRDATSAWAGRLADIVQLGKPRITMLVLVSTALGYALGSPEPMRWGFDWLWCQSRFDSVTSPVPPNFNPIAAPP